MLRITPKSESPNAVELILEGRLISDWIPEVEDACRRHRSANEEVSLNLAGVAFVDGAGLAALRRLISSDVRIVDCPPLIENLLHDEREA